MATSNTSSPMKVCDIKDYSSEDNDLSLELLSTLTTTKEVLPTTNLDNLTANNSLMIETPEVTTMTAVGAISASSACDKYFHVLAQRLLGITASSRHCNARQAMLQLCFSKLFF